MMPFPAAMLGKPGAAPTPAGLSIVSNSGSMQHGRASSAVVSLPATYAAGDLLILHVGVVGSSSSTNINTPAGWTQYAQGTMGAADWKAAIFYKVATGSEGSSVTVSFTGSNLDYSCTSVAIRGQHATPFEGAVASSTAGSGNPSSPDVTTLGAGRLVLHFITSWHSNPQTYTPGAGWAPDYNRSGPGSAFSECTLCMTYKEMPTAGAAGAESGTASASFGWRTYSIIVVPA